MSLNPIVNAKLKKFKDDFWLTCNDDEAFEKYTNYNILSQFQPGVLSSDLELMDLISVGGGDDLGLDGIAIFLNGQMIKSCEDIEGLLAGNKKGKFELVFTQAKNKKKFDYGEFLKFTTGVFDFLQEEISKQHNREINTWHSIYQYIMSNDIIIRWSENPSIKLFYVVNGPLEYAPNIVKHIDEVKRNIMNKNSFGEVEVYLIDEKKLINLIDYNENNYDFVINIIDSMPLPEVENVDNSRVVLCQASELVKMITTNEGTLRRNIFDDNVRDYQGDSSINLEIQDTISSEPERFVLLNNGITVVCSGITDANRKLKISNPQVVNGCQTCCVLYYSQKKGVNVEKIFTVVKFIGTDNDDIVNCIVKGTNRQNIVYEAAFAITSEFHKMLEKYFSAMSINENKIFYERRSKQYDANQLVKPLQKVTFRTLIQSMVSIFLERPEEGHLHESILLNNYKNILFKEGQSYAPYYLSAYIYLLIEKMYRSHVISQEIYTYKMQVMTIFKALTGGPSPDINRKKEIDKYCSKILQILNDAEETQKYVHKAAAIFVKISNMWVCEKGEQYRDARKDRAEFTKFLLDNIYDEGTENRGIQTIGKVLTIKTDKNGMFYGFIQRIPDSIYFGEYDNPSICLEYENQMVSYEVKEYKGKVKAINVSLIND